MSTTCLTLIVALMLAATNAYGQETVTVSGVVLDARTRQPLASVLVNVENLSTFVETDSEGRFALHLPAGGYTLMASMIGYVVVRHDIELSATSPAPPLVIELSEGAGTFEQHVTVSGDASHDVAGTPAAAALHGRELQALRGVALDDPLRAVQALPSATATDDFYSEFAVRGLGFGHTNLVVDGIPSAYMMHSVHGVADGGSIAMVNSDAVSSVALLPGGYAQRIGRRMGSKVDLAIREGDRRGFRLRAGLSGTSATALAEGPLATRGSWLFSARRSYMDLLLKRIDEDNSLAFAFTDTLAKVAFDANPNHQFQVLAVLGASSFNEAPEGLGPNDEEHVRGQSWLAALNWRYAPSARMTVTQRVHTTGVAFKNRNLDDRPLNDRMSTDAGWRADAAVQVAPAMLVEFGGDAQRLAGRHQVWRALDDSRSLSLLSSYRVRDSAASAYGQLVFTGWSRLRLAPGARIDYWGPTSAATSSPWLNAELLIARSTRVRFGSGLYRQFADLEQVHGIRGGGEQTRPETARHFDVGVIQPLPGHSTLQATWFARDERDVLWTPGAEPRRTADGLVQPGRGDAAWVNALSGRARGLEVLFRRDAPAGLSGWAGYAYNHHRYTDSAGAESFDADADQRHSLSLFGYYRLSNRSTIGAKFRYGSNYPRVGYIEEQRPDDRVPSLLGGAQPVFYGLSSSRNGLRLPAYARVDIRADRSFLWSRRRLTLFVELANATNHRNVRNVPYSVDRIGRVFGGIDSLLPIFPSAGFVVDF